MRHAHRRLPVTRLTGGMKVFAEALAVCLKKQAQKFLIQGWFAVGVAQAKLAVDAACDDRCRRCRCLGRLGRLLCGRRQIRLQRIQQVTGADRLGQIAVHPGHATALALGWQGAGGQGNDRQATITLVLPQAARGFIAIHDRHLAVHEDAVGKLRGNCDNGLLSVAGQAHLDTGTLQHVACHFKIELHVVNQQDLHPLQPAGRHTRFRLTQRRPGRPGGLRIHIQKRQYFGKQPARRRRFDDHPFVQRRIDFVRLLVAGGAQQDERRQGPDTACQAIAQAVQSIHMTRIGGGYAIKHRQTVRQLGMTDRIQRLAGRREICHLQAELMQLSADRSPADRIAINQQQWALRISLQALSRCRKAFATRYSPFQQDEKAEFAALPGNAFDRNMAAHQFDQSLADDQSQPGTAVASGGRGVGLGEGAEQARLLIRRHADALVAHLEAELNAPAFECFHANLDDDVAPFGKFDRIADQVDQHLLQPQRVADKAACARMIHIEDQFDGFLGRLFRQQLTHAVEHRIQIERLAFDFKPAGFDPGEIEDVIDDAQQGIRGPLYPGEVAVLPGIQLGRQTQLGNADDRIHRRTDFVTHVGEKVAARLRQLLGLTACLFAQRIKSATLDHFKKGQQQNDQRHHPGGNDEQAGGFITERTIINDGNEGKRRFGNLHPGQQMRAGFFLRMQVHEMHCRFFILPTGCLGEQFLPGSVVPPQIFLVRFQQQPAMAVDQQSLSGRRRVAKLGKDAAHPNPGNHLPPVNLIVPHRGDDQQALFLWHINNPCPAACQLQRKLDGFQSFILPPARNELAILIHQRQRRIKRLITNPFALCDSLKAVLDELDIDAQAIFIAHAQIAIGEKSIDHAGFGQFGNIADPLGKEIGNRRRLLLGLKPELRQTVFLQTMQ